MLQMIAVLWVCIKKRVCDRFDGAHDSSPCIYVIPFRLTWTSCPRRAYHEVISSVKSVQYSRTELYCSRALFSGRSPLSLPLFLHCLPRALSISFDTVTNLNPFDCNPLINPGIAFNRKWWSKIHRWRGVGLRRKVVMKRSEKNGGRGKVIRLSLLQESGVFAGIRKQNTLVAVFWTLSVRS